MKCAWGPCPIDVERRHDRGPVPKYCSDAHRQRAFRERKHPPANPSSSAEWQEAVDAAEFLLLVDSARLYGLVAGGPSVDVDRCEEILRLGRERGMGPRPLDTLIAEWVPAMTHARAQHPPTE